jgi:hypothetical protein
MAHQHDPRGDGNTPAHHHDCGGLFGCGDETGVYVDRILDVGGSLRFAERIVVCDSSHFDTLVAIPL